MIVQHNLTAMNANRMLGLTQSSQAKSTEKLSSGYKINRAADDAAGLSISEKMRKQIRGLSQASLNAEDGISAVQTAEGALTEVQDMLQRMNELAVKSANGTMSEIDRDYIQDEIDQLVTEIDRVAETTKFNETYLLKGNADGDTETVYEYATSSAGIGAASGVTLYNADGTEATVTQTSIDDALAAGYFTGKDAVDSAAVYNATVAAVSTSASGGVTSAYYLGNDRVYDADGNEIAESALGSYFNLTSMKASASVYTKIEGVGAAASSNFAEAAATTAKLYNASGDEIAAEDLASLYDSTGAFTATGIYSTNSGNSTDSVDATNISDFVEADEKVVALNFKLHVGADSTDNNQISVDIEAMSADGLGLLDENKKLLVNGEDDANARAAIDTIAEALQKVSTQRSALGAVQNRLEHTINNLDNVVENTTAAEAQIRDTDMATEMVKYSNNNILAQAGQAMLAQANQANQGVLSLLS